MIHRYFEYDWFNTIEELVKFLNKNNDIIVNALYTSTDEDGYVYFNVIYHRDPNVQFRKRYETVYMSEYIKLDWLNANGNEQLNIVGVFQETNEDGVKCYTVVYCSEQNI